MNKLISLSFSLLLFANSVSAIIINEATPEQKADNLIATADASVSEQARCSNEQVWGWGMARRVNGIPKDKILISVPVSDTAPTLGIVAPGLGTFFSPSLPIFAEGDKHNLTFFCGADSINNKVISKLKIVLNDGVISIASSGSNNKPNKPKPFKLPGFKVFPVKPNKTQIAQDLFNINPNGKSFNIQSTIEPSEDKKIFRATLSRSFTLNIKNNGSQDFTFVVIDRKSKEEFKTLIPIGESKDIELRKGKIQLNILRVDKEEGVPADFDITVSDSESGEQIIDFSQLLNEVFDLTGTFASFNTPEFIRFNLALAIKLKVEKLQGNFDINIFRIKKGKRIEILPDANNIYDFTKRGKHEIKLTPLEEEGDYHVTLEVID